MEDMMRRGAEDDKEEDDKEEAQPLVADQEKPTKLDTTTGSGSGSGNGAYANYGANKQAWV